jgi:hypothetical protein
VGKRPTNDGVSGEEVFEARTIGALRTLDCYLDMFHPTPVGRAAEPHYWRSERCPIYGRRHATENNIRLIEMMSRNHDTVICS